MCAKRDAVHPSRQQPQRHGRHAFSMAQAQNRAIQNHFEHADQQSLWNGLYPFNEPFKCTQGGYQHPQFTDRMEASQKHQYPEYHPEHPHTIYNTSPYPLPQASYMDALIGSQIHTQQTFPSPSANPHAYSHELDVLSAEDLSYKTDLSQTLCDQVYDSVLDFSQLQNGQNHKLEYLAKGMTSGVFDQLWSGTFDDIGAAPPLQNHGYKAYGLESLDTNQIRQGYQDSPDTGVYQSKGQMHSPLGVQTSANEMFMWSSSYQNYHETAIATSGNADLDNATDGSTLSRKSSMSEPQISTPRMSSTNPFLSSDYRPDLNRVQKRSALGMPRKISGSHKASDDPLGPNLIEIPRIAKKPPKRKEQFFCAEPGCKKGVGRLSDLDRHGATQHSGKATFKCRMCPPEKAGKRYSVKYNLREHMLRSHADKVNKETIKYDKYLNGLADRFPKVPAYKQSLNGDIILRSLKENETFGSDLNTHSLDMLVSSPEHHQNVHSRALKENEIFGSELNTLSFGMPVSSLKHPQDANGHGNIDPELLMEDFWNII